MPKQKKPNERSRGFARKPPSHQTIEADWESNQPDQIREMQPKPEQSYRALTEFLPIPIFDIDPNGKLISYNRSALDVFRYTREDFKEGMNASQFFPPMDWSKVVKDLKNVISGNSTLGQVYTLLRKDGTTFPGAIYASLFTDDDNEQRIRGAIIDMSDHAHTQILQEAVYRIASAAETTLSLEELYAQIHQIISSVMPAENFYIALYDEAENLLRFSYFKDAEDEPFMGGVQPKKGLTAYVLRTGKSLLCTQAVHDELERRGEVKLLGVPSAIWLGVPLTIEGKTIGAMVLQHYSDPEAYGEREQHMLEFVSTQVAIAINRKRAEEALRRSEAELRALFASMQDVVLVIDRQGTYLKVAPTNPKLLLMPPEDLLGKKLQDVFPAKQAKIFRKVVKEVLETSQTIQIEYDLSIAGETIWFAASISPITEDSTLWVAHDITSRKRSESVQNALYRIAQMAITSESSEALYELIHVILGELIPAKNFYIAIFDPQSQMISFPYYVDQYDDQPPMPMPFQGLTGYVIKTGKPLLASRDIFDWLVDHGKIDVVGTPAIDWMGAPLKIGDRLIGVMAVQIYQAGIHYVQEDLNLLEFVSNQVAQAIERKRMEEQIHNLSLSDALTGLYNRRGFTILAEQEVKLANRINRTMLLFFLDMDDLKGINDFAWACHGRPGFAGSCCYSEGNLPVCGHPGPAGRGRIPGHGCGCQPGERRYHDGSHPDCSGAQKLQRRSALPIDR